MALFICFSRSFDVIADLHFLPQWDHFYIRTLFFLNSGTESAFLNMELCSLGAVELILPNLMELCSLGATDLDPTGRG